MPVKRVNSDFDRQIHQFVVKTGIRVDVFTKAVAFKVWNSVTMMTPVDTGRARASWTFVEGEDANLAVAPKEMFSASSAEGEITRDAAAAAAAAYAGGQIRLKGLIPVYTVANNLVYIERLEEGSSQQAPVGMVKVAIAEVVAEMQSLVVKARNSV